MKFRAATELDYVRLVEPTVECMREQVGANRFSYWGSMVAGLTSVTVLISICMLKVYMGAGLTWLIVLPFAAAHTVILHRAEHRLEESKYVLREIISERFVLWEDYDEQEQKKITVLGVCDSNLPGEYIKISSCPCDVRKKRTDKTGNTR